MDLLDQIRKAIERSGKSRYVISKKTGVDQASLSRFLAGKQGLSTRSLDAIARFLEISIARSDERAR